MSDPNCCLGAVRQERPSRHARAFGSQRRSGIGGGRNAGFRRPPIGDRTLQIYRGSRIRHSADVAPI